MNAKPDLQVTMATAQAIVDCALSGRTVAAVSTIHGGDIAAVYEIAFVEPEPPSFVVKFEQEGIVEETYLVIASFFAGLVFARDLRTGALAGIIGGVLAALVLGGMLTVALVFYTLAIPQLLALIGPELVRAVLIFGFAGAAGGLVRNKLSR